MKFKVENLGALKNAEFELNDLNVIVGKNNSGKTYLAYAIYNTISRLLDHDIITSLKDFGYKEIDIFNEKNYKDEKYQIDFSEYEEPIISSFSKYINFLMPIDMKNTTLTNSNITLSSNNFFVNTLNMIIDWRNINNDVISVNFFKKPNSFLFEVKLKYSENTKPEIILNSENDKIDDINPNNLYKHIKISPDNIKLISKTVLQYINNLLNKRLLEKYFTENYNNQISYIPSSREGILMSIGEIVKSRNKNNNIISEKNFIKTNFEESEQLNLYNNISINNDNYFPKPVSDFIDNIIEKIFSDNNKHYILDHNKNYTNKKNIDAQKSLEKLMNGNILLKENKFFFLPNDTEIKLDLNQVSSLVKSLFSIYINLTPFPKNKILIIDEPEANLHPDNQRKLARIFAMMINNGYKIILTTHSDIFVREFSNLIAIKNIKKTSKNKILKKFDIPKNSILDKEKVSFFKIENSELELIEYDDKHIFIDSFDDVINNQNDLFEAIEEASDDDE